MTEPWSAARAARWLAQAFESGDPLAPLPEGIAPRDLREAEQVAAAVIEELAITPCGLRVWRPGIAGPMIEGRLLPNGAAVSLAGLRHPLATAAVIGVLAEPLAAEGDAPPVFARLHPALDVSATRFTAAPEDALTLTADLARLGLTVAGKGKPVPEATPRVSLAPKGTRARGVEVDVLAALAEAAATARRWGGLPAGALLVVAGLSGPVAPGGMLRTSFGGLGAAEATFA